MYDRVEVVFIGFAIGHYNAWFDQLILFCPVVESFILPFLKKQKKTGLNFYCKLCSEFKFIFESFII